MKEVEWVNPDSSAEFEEFRDIQPPFPEFDLRYERLPLPNASSQLSLGYASVFSSLDKPLDDTLIKFGSKGCHTAAPVENQRAIETRN